MSSIAIACIAFACVFGGALLGLLFRTVLPEEHLSTDTKDVVKLGIALYRVLEDPVQFADAGLGFRAWGFSSRVALNPGLLPGVSVTPSGGWTDPLIGARYHRELGNGFALTAYADVGGFGVGAHIDWQVLGTVDYSLSPSWDLHLGYRSLNFNITGSEGRFGFNVHMRGPIFAGTFRF